MSRPIIRARARDANGARSETWFRVERPSAWSIEDAARKRDHWVSGHGCGRAEKALLSYSVRAVGAAAGERLPSAESSRRGTRLRNAESRALTRTATVFQLSAVSLHR